MKETNLLNSEEEKELLIPKKGVEAIIHQLLVELGENPNREGLLKTPKRVAKAYSFFTSGYAFDPDQLLNSAVFKEDYDEMVVVKDIDFFSLCEHHLLPFFGRCHVAYIPDGKILGLSKVARLVEVMSRRFQVQERLTNQIAKLLQEHLKPLGVAVVMEAQHLCMMMRGIQKLNSVAVTSSMLGTFRKGTDTRMEFMQLIKK